MFPQFVTIHDIYKSIKDVGVRSYANTIVRNMAGEFHFVDAEVFEDDENLAYWARSDGWKVERVKLDRDYYYIKYKIHPIPCKIADFIIQALRLKSNMSQLAIGSREDIRDSGSQAVYLTPGKELFGHKIERLTEIPAELMPVVVDRL